ncbi:MAG: 50S ribosomal protein L10 [bacterium]|jgi:large subunit ribosomal protein L10
MALTRQKKEDIVSTVSDLLAESKLTVVAKYTGTTVKNIQALRDQAEENDTNIKVIKNRLIIKALASNDKFKNIDTSEIKGQLLYAFNPRDEVAPAKDLATFAKLNPTIEFVGAISSDGLFISAEDVKALSQLPTKDQLRAQLVGTISAPLNGFVNVLAGNIRGVYNVLNARADAINN